MGGYFAFGLFLKFSSLELIVFSIKFVNFLISVMIALWPRWVAKIDGTEVPAPSSKIFKGIALSLFFRISLYKILVIAYDCKMI